MLSKVGTRGASWNTCAYCVKKYGVLYSTSRSVVGGAPLHEANDERCRVCGGEGETGAGMFAGGDEQTFHKTDGKGVVEEGIPRELSIAATESLNIIRAMTCGLVR